MAVRSLRYILTGEDKSASRSLDRVGKKADGLNHKLAALGGAGLGAGLVVFGKQSAEAFKEAEEAQKKLEFSFSKFPKLADTNIGALRDLNTQLARKTKYDDDAIATGQATLAQFNLTGKQIAAVTPLLLDYADATGKEMPDAAQDLGKALLGNAKALKNVGIAYKSTGDRGKDFENIQGLLNQKVGGFAEKEGKTASGQAAILKNQYGELQETVGSKLVPRLNDAASALLQVVDFTNRNSKVIKPLAIAVGGFAAAVWGVNKATAAWQATEKAFLVVKGLFTTAVVAEGVATGTTATAVTGLAAAETAAGAAGGIAATGIGAAALAAGAAVAPFVAATGAAYGLVKLLKWMDDHPDAQKNIIAGSPTATIKLPGKPTPTITFDGVTVPRGPVPPPTKRNFGLAKGGPMKAGFTYLTGENGPELITAKRSGYVHNAHETSRLLFNPKARLDASQVVDDRLMSRMMMTPLSPYGNVRQGRAPTGMGNYIVVKVEQSRSKTSKAVTTETRRRQRNGHPLPFGL